MVLKYKRMPKFWRKRREYLLYKDYRLKNSQPKLIPSSFPTPSMKKILFLCTGNYYRSRFAEKLFNNLATQQNLDWEADSRGLAIERGVNNVGAMSRYAVEALKQRGINILPEERFPKSAIADDFQKFDLIVAVDESEHRPLMQERFLQWMDNIEYWLIHDIDRTSPQEALEELEQKVQELIENLRLNH